MTLTGAEAAPGSTFAALRFPRYRLLWTGGLIVFFAVTGQAIARGWLALELTGTNAGLGGVLLAFGLCMLIATPWGGVAADRLSKKRILLVAMAILSLSAGWIGIAVAFDFVEYWMLVGASGLQAIAFALYGPARMAYISELVDRDTMTNAIVLGQMSAEAMRVVGPGLAGALIGTAWFGVAGVFLLSAGLCLVAMATAFSLPVGLPPEGRPRRSPLEDVADGIAYVRHEHGLMLLTLTSLGVVIVGFPYIAFLPSVAGDLFEVGSGGYGLMSAVAASGAVVAGLLTARQSRRGDPWRLLSLSGLAFGVALLLLALAPRYGVALAVLPVVGAAGLAFQTTDQSLLLALSDFEYHGRVQGIVMLGFSGFGIAALPLGILADAIGLRVTLALMGAAVILVMLAFAAGHRRYRTLALMRDLG